jgi:hypothetical protein
MGTCNGFPSPNSPRMLTSVTSGNRPARMSDSRSIRLPMPLDCISSAARARPRQAPAAWATPSSSVASGIARTDGSAKARRITASWPASGTQAKCVTPPARIVA